VETGRSTCALAWATASALTSRAPCLPKADDDGPNAAVDEGPSGLAHLSERVQPTTDELLELLVVGLDEVRVGRDRRR
jgi:hypothetical protein